MHSLQMTVTVPEKCPVDIMNIVSTDCEMNVINCLLDNMILEDD